MYMTLGIIAATLTVFFGLATILVPELADALDNLGRTLAYVVLVPFVIVGAFFTTFDPTDYNNDAY